MEAMLDGVTNTIASTINQGVRMIGKYQVRSDLANNIHPDSKIINTDK